MRADDEGVWCGACKGRMRAEAGRRFPGRREWIWWTCQDCGGVEGTCPLPIGSLRREDQARSETDDAACESQRSLRLLT